MCCISKPIVEVASTKLFCGVNQDKNRQFTVYSNTVNNQSKNNAMVLPVPYPESVKFHNLESYKTFFDDCQDCFKIPRNMTYGLSFRNSYSFEGDTLSAQKKLEVVDVGSYQVSLAKNLKELKFVDKDVFELSKGLEETLTKHYNDPMFGFIICKLATGKENYHPFAYSHKMMGNKVFIPTRHYHDETQVVSGHDFFKTNKYSSETIDNSPMFSGWGSDSMLNKKKNNDDTYADDWDHDIYLYNVNQWSDFEVRRMSKSEEVWTNEVKINFNKIDFPLDRDCKSFQKLKINGSHKNMDIMLEAI